MDKLRECPFCGGEATSHEYTCRRFVVHCKDCSAEIERSCIKGNPAQPELLTQAIKAWNTRASDKALEVTEEMCEEVHKAYCKYCIDIKGEEYWTKGDYSKLSEDVKEADRYTAKSIIEHIRKRLG